MLKESQTYIFCRRAVMNLQDLIYFHYLAESLSFTDTAAHFFVSQPSISTAIKRLETAFNASLIDRRKTLKKMELTPAGKILYKNTAEILEKLDQTRQKIEDIELGSVYFGFLPTIGGYFLPEILVKSIILCKIVDNVMNAGCSIIQQSN